MIKVLQSQFVVVALTGLFYIPIPILAQSARQTSVKSHRKMGVNESAVRGIAPDFSMMETLLEDGVKRDSIVTNRHRTYDAFTVSGTRLFVAGRRTGKVFEVRGLPLEWRPFSDLVWTDNQTLHFDRWSQPHYGIHYSVNVKRKKLISAVPFSDEFYLKRQRSKRRTNR